MKYRASVLCACRRENGGGFVVSLNFPRFVNTDFSPPARGMSALKGNTSQPKDPCQKPNETKSS